MQMRPLLLLPPSSGFEPFARAQGCAISTAGIWGGLEAPRRLHPCFLNLCTHVSSQSSQLPIFWACPELACGAGRGLASEACFLWVHYPAARCPTASDPGRSLFATFSFFAFGWESFCFRQPRSPLASMSWQERPFLRKSHGSAGPSPFPSLFRRNPPEAFSVHSASINRTAACGGGLRSQRWAG